MELRRLKAEDYDSLLDLLNKVFSIKNQRQVDFEKDLPKMWARTDEQMGKHFGVFEDGKLVSALGVYPLPTIIDGEEFMFSTVGNIATDKEYEGKGYMSQLIDVAMQELKDIKADVSRLGGLRKRYNRYGYETCGKDYGCSLSTHNRQNSKFHFDNLTFTVIEKNDKEALSFVKEICYKRAIIAKREDNEIYDCLTAWQNKPYLALKNGVPFGYVSVSAAGNSVAEYGCIDEEQEFELLLGYQQWLGNTINFIVPSYNLITLRKAYEDCESVRASSPCHFKIINWQKLISALMRLRAKRRPFNNGELTFSIEDYGGIRLWAKDGAFGCERVEEQGRKLDVLTATRILFGVSDASCIIEKGEEFEKFCPLPLSWSLQDRV